MREGEIVSKEVRVEREVAAELKALREMKKKYERLKLEHEILKKAIAYSSTRSARSSSSSPRTVKRSRSG
jgi:transposase